jgi:methylated-DNA-[protein]-cysteine S-methyltransferase
MYSAYLDSPIGIIEMIEFDGKISSIQFIKDKDKETSLTELLKIAKVELQAYFNGELKDFSFPMQQHGTDFQQEVWRNLKAIPFGYQVSYTTLAIRMNNLPAIRAIAATNGKNKILIAVPCHRIIGMSGDMTGYAGEIWRKKWLLEHESKVAGIGQASLTF